MQHRSVRVGILLLLIIGFSICLTALRLSRNNGRSVQPLQDSKSLQTLNIDGLKLKFSYPTPWGNASVSSGDGLACAFDVEFSDNRDVHLCAYSLRESRNCIGPCDAFVDEATFESDRVMLQSYQRDLNCSLTATDCHIVDTPSQIRLLSYYDFRPLRKIYVLYNAVYRVEISLDLPDVKVPVPQIAGEAPDNIQHDLAELDQMALSISPIK
jgi:hypothetical protein